MRKYLLKIGLIICVLAAVLFSVLKNTAEGVLLEMLQKVAGEEIMLGMARIHFDSAVPDEGCWLSACVRLEDVKIIIPDHSLTLGTVHLRWPLKYPLRLMFDGQNDEKTTLKGVAFQDHLMISQMDISDDVFRVTGTLSLQVKPALVVDGIVETKGLMTFLASYLQPELLSAMRPFLSNNTQLLRLGTDKGWLTVNNWPLWPIGVTENTF